jgi:2-phosphosulfolactate phosphatase
MYPAIIGIGVSFTPFERSDAKPSVFIMVDVIRASSSIVTLFERDCDRIFLTDDITRLCASERTELKGFKICAEDAVGRKLECADFSPSLTEIGKYPTLVGSNIIIQTSNGTAAIHLLAKKGASTILIGSMLNAKAVMKKALALAGEQGLNISIICAGRNGGTWATIDDVYCAAKLVDYAIRLMDEGCVELDIFDSAKIALAQLPFYQDTSAAFHASASAENLRKIGSTEDIELCTRDSISEIVPMVTWQKEYPFIEVAIR